MAKRFLPHCQGQSPRHKTHCLRTKFPHPNYVYAVFYVKTAFLMVRSLKKHPEIAVEGEILIKICDVSLEPSRKIPVFNFILFRSWRDIDNSKCVDLLQANLADVEDELPATIRQVPQFSRDL